MSKITRGSEEIEKIKAKILDAVVAIKCPCLSTFHEA